MSRPGWIAIAAAAALLPAPLAVAGCGGGGGGPTKAQYIARADRICRTAQVRSAPLTRRIGQLVALGKVSERQMREGAGVLDRLHRLGARYIADLRALEQPKGDEQAIAAFLTPTSRVVDALAAARDALRRGAVVQALSLLGQAEPLDADAARAAGAYGFKRCGSVVGAGG